MIFPGKICFKRLDFARWDFIDRKHPDFGSAPALKAQYSYNYYDIFDENIAGIDEF